jgi:phage shock protein PspC (stress-responsive transcriptional regulator)
MKKIININLSGRVIPIEDLAYEKLQAYIESLRRYFANEEGRDEIINDIEGRIAELMNEKIRLGSAAITDADVNEIVSSMGTVEDFEAADKESAESKAQPQSEPGYTYTSSKPKGRLYRDNNEKFIGGVCSGIANYINVDPAVVRLLFAILGFATGIGILAYIILWIVLPPRDLDGYVGRRLYRNPDSKIIGGVAGGLAAYFNKRASSIRLIFIFPILLNILISALNHFRWEYDVNFALNIGFGSLSGFFILTYIVLWIVLPEANSDYQKMEMRGETVDVNRIRQNVKEGMQNMKGRMKEWGQEVKESAQNFSNKAKDFSNTRGRAFAADARETVRRTGGGIGHIIGVLFKAFFLFIVGSIAFGLFVAFIALIFGGVAWWPVNNFLWTSKWQQLYAWGTLIFFLGVPLIGFIVWVIRRIMKVRSKSNYLGWTFGGLWLIGWVVAILFASSISRDFSAWKNDGGTELSLTQPVNGKMIVAVTEPQLELSGNLWWIHDDGGGWDITSDTFKLSTVKIDDVQPSLDANYHVIITKYSYGRTTEEAMDRARAIQFKALSKDSILDLGSGYAISKDKKFRFQQVHVEIQVPVGKKIRFDQSIKEKLSQVNFKVTKRYKNGKIIDINIDEDNFNNGLEYATGVDYIMGTDRKLHGPDGQTLNETPADYRYDQKDSVSIQKQLDDARKKEKQDSIENKKRIKELEEKQRTSQSKPTTLNFKKINSEQERGYSFGLSPISSLTQLF